MLDKCPRSTYLNVRIEKPFTKLSVNEAWKKGRVQVINNLRRPPLDLSPI